MLSKYNTLVNFSSVLIPLLMLPVSISSCGQRHSADGERPRTAHGADGGPPQLGGGAPRVGQSLRQGAAAQDQW